MALISVALSATFVSCMFFLIFMRINDDDDDGDKPVPEW